MLLTNKELVHGRFGNIIVDDINLGEYTLAVWDRQIVGATEVFHEPFNVKIYPNPSRGVINFEFPRKGKLFDKVI